MKILVSNFIGYFRKFEEKLAKDFPLRADGQKTTLELVRLAELGSMLRLTPPSFS